MSVQVSEIGHNKKDPPAKSPAGLRHIVWSVATRSVCQARRCGRVIAKKVKIDVAEEAIVHLLRAGLRGLKKQRWSGRVV